MKSLFWLFLFFTPLLYFFIPITQNPSSMVVTVTAYSSTPDQTNYDPFTMANGKRVHDGAIAANFLPFGTKVRIPDLYGDKIFVVEDRMHRRFDKRVDIWMPSREEAKLFGKQTARIEIIQ